MFSEFGFWVNTKVNKSRFWSIESPFPGWTAVVNNGSDIFVDNKKERRSNATIIYGWVCIPIV